MGEADVEDDRGGCRRCGQMIEADVEDEEGDDSA